MRGCRKGNLSLKQCYPKLTHERWHGKNIGRVMKLIFAEEAWEDYMYWVKNDKKILKRINELIKAIQRDPHKGIGEPEPLRSRRINREHRLVYMVENDAVLIAQCRYHY